MKNSSKLTLSQSLVAVPAAFSATTYNINETLSFSDYTGTDDIFYSSLFFDVSTGNIQKIVGDSYSSSSSSVYESMDIAISLSRTTSTSGTYTKGKSKSEGSTYKALASKSDSSPIQINANWKADNMYLDSSGSLSDDRLKAGFVGSQVLTPTFGAFFGLASTTSDPLIDDFNSYFWTATSGTKYLGFSGDPSNPSNVELYAQLSFTYTGPTSFADSVLVEKFVVGDPGEDLLNYTLVPENKHSAAMLALLAGSAAVFSKRRKAS